MGPSSSSSEDMQIGKFKSISAAATAEAAEASMGGGGVRLHEERWCFVLANGIWDLHPLESGLIIFRYYPQMFLATRVQVTVFKKNF